MIQVEYVIYLGQTGTEFSTDKLHAVQESRIWSKVAFVIPSFNDSIALKRFLPELPASALKLIVDDGSLEPFSNPSSKHLYVIRHFTNLGQGAALETGFEYLRTYRPDIEYVFTFDADGQHSFEDAAAMLDSMRAEPCDVLLGSRFLLRQGYDHFEGGLPKYLLLKFAAFISRLTLGMKLTDRHNGLRLLNRRALEKIVITTSGYGHADEILRRISANSLKYREFPVTIKYKIERERPGQSILSSVKIVFDRLWGGN